MKCRQAARNLSAYLDNEIGEPENTRVREHLHSCARCREELAGMERLERVIQSLQVPEVPAGLSGVIMTRRARARLGRQAPRNEASILRMLTRGMPVLARLAPIGALATGIVLGILIGRDLWHPPQAEARVANQAWLDNPIDIYNLDTLGDRPKGSLGAAFLGLINDQGEAP